MNDAERKLIRFAAKVIDAHRNDGYPGDVDGGWLQDTLAECGVLMPVRVEAPCSETDCVCADCDGIPGECYRLTAEAQTTMAEAETEVQREGTENG